MITPTGTGVDLSVSVVPRRPAVAISFVLPSGLVPSRSSLPGALRLRQWVATFVAPPREGIAWRATFDGTAASRLNDLRVIVTDSGFPGGSGWQRLPDWPPACARTCPKGLTPIYLAQGKGLGFEAPAAQAWDSYVSDPARPVTYRQRPTISPWATGSTWRFWLEDDQRFAEARPDVLTYQSAPLTQPLALRGTPLVHLVASTSGTDSDWVVKLIDVYPPQDREKPQMGGYQLAIAMDVMRGRYRADPARPQPLAPNQPLTYEFALPTVNYVVQPGHRLMVQVQSSWFPLYDRNPQTFVPNIFFAKADDYRAAMQKVFTGAEGTWIGLPVVK